MVVKFLASYADKQSTCSAIWPGEHCVVVRFGHARALSEILSTHVVISTPLPCWSYCRSLPSVMSILMGLIAEIIMRTLYESQGKQVYLVRDTINLPDSNICAELRVRRPGKRAAFAGDERRDDTPGPGWFGQVHRSGPMACFWRIGGWRYSTSPEASSRCGTRTGRSASSSNGELHDNQRWI